MYLHVGKQLGMILTYRPVNNFIWYIQTCINVAIESIILKISCNDNGKTFTLQEELVKQLTTQIADLERFVTFLQGLSWCYKPEKEVLNTILISEFRILYFVYAKLILFTSVWSVNW